MKPPNVLALGGHPFRDLPNWGPLPKVEGAKQGSATVPPLLETPASRLSQGPHLGSRSPPASRRDPKEAARLLTSSSGAAASTSFHFAGEVVGANGSRVPVTDPPAGPACLLARSSVGCNGEHLGKALRLGGWGEFAGRAWTWLSWHGRSGRTGMRGSGRERRHERGYKLGAGLTAFLPLRASAFGRSQRAALLVLRGSFTFSHCWGKGGRKGVMRWFGGLRGKVAFPVKCCFQPRFESCLTRGFQALSVREEESNKLHFWWTSFRPSTFVFNSTAKYSHECFSAFSFRTFLISSSAKCSSAVLRSRARGGCFILLRWVHRN